MLRVFPISLTGAASRWLRNEPTDSIKTLEDLNTKFLNKYCPPGRTAKKMKEINNFQQEPDETLYQAWEHFKELWMKCPQHYFTEMQDVILFYNGGRSTETSDGLAAIQAQLNNLGREIKKVNEKVYAAQVGCEQCKGPHYTKDYPLKEEGKTLEEAYYTRLDNHYCEEEEGNCGPKFMEAYGASHINNVIPQKEKDLGSFTLPCFINNTCFDNALVDLGASVSVMPLLTYLNLGLGELAHTRLTVELADRTCPEHGRPFLSTSRAKIDVYKRNITLRVGEERIVFSSVKPASSLIKRVYMLSLRERMELDLEATLIGETLVLNISLDPFLEDYIELNDLNEPFELRRNQGDDLMPTIEEGEVIEEFRTRNEDLDTGIDDYPKDMDAYLDEGMGDVIFGEPFLREVGIKTKRFKGIITLYKSDDEVSKKYKENGISHSYQELKGFYKGVLKLGPDYILDAKKEEWLIHGNISVHEME
ncbi:putative reverse transcriptase domain-containing protein [Tanacetum coccineum]